jgi:hypothetical protein
MKVVDLTGITRRHTVLHYRRSFTGTAVLENSGARREERPVHFVVEHAPLGPTTITVHFTGSQDDITQPLVEALRERVQALDTAGKLP